MTLLRITIVDAAEFPFDARNNLNLTDKTMTTLKERVISYEEIETMPPGGELNTLIAINVGKWHRRGRFSIDWYTYDGFRIADGFEPSRSLDDCFKACQATNWHVYLDRQIGDEPGTERWTASVIVSHPTWIHQRATLETGPPLRMYRTAMAETGALALSRALLMTALSLSPGNFLFEESFERVEYNSGMLSEEKVGHIGHPKENIPVEMSHPSNTQHLADAVTILEAQSLSAKNICIFDLDGTIALIEHRRHWLDERQHIYLSLDERWRNFFADCEADEPNFPVIETLRTLYESREYRIVIFSGRSDEVKEQTVEWLRFHLIPYHALRMRNAGDFTPDEVLKRRWLAEMNKDEILMAFDDRDKVVEMWRSEGVPCFQVAPGDF